LPTWPAVTYAYVPGWRTPHARRQRSAAQQKHSGVKGSACLWACVVPSTGTPACTCAPPLPRHASHARARTHTHTHTHTHTQTRSAPGSMPSQLPSTYDPRSTEVSP
jgi:hypothetical protein